MKSHENIMCLRASGTKKMQNTRCHLRQTRYYVYYKKLSKCYGHFFSLALLSLYFNNWAHAWTAWVCISMSSTSDEKLMNYMRPEVLTLNVIKIEFVWWANEHVTDPVHTHRKRTKRWFDPNFYIPNINCVKRFAIGNVNMSFDIKR